MNKIKLSIFIVSGVLMLSGWLMPHEAHAIYLTVTVNSASDVADMNPGDGVCDVSVNAGDQCTLRAALQEILAFGPGTSPHRVEFAIPGNGPFTITLNSKLPEITVPLVIDGETQTGATCPTANAPANIQITVDGLNIPGFRQPGFLLFSDNSIISGLSIVNFGSSGVEVKGNNNTVRCNHIGVDAAGAVGLGNGIGIEIKGSNNTVGGDSFADRNVISANNGLGIGIDAYISSTVSNVVAGNYIGTAADGLTPLGNGSDAIVIAADNNTIGGFTASERNVIANNGFVNPFTLAGVTIIGDNNTIINNYIGVNKNGEPQGNAGHGIYISTFSDGITVGSYSAPNVIAHNAENGVWIGQYGEENAIRVNIIRDNGFLGIDLTRPYEVSGEVTPNDPGVDDDSGANTLQNYPVLTTADINGRIQGSINGFPGNEISFFFYVNESCDESGYGEGEQFVQAVDVAIPDSGVDLDFDIVLDAPLMAGQYVTATAIDIDNGNTSEFSNCVQVSAATYEVTATSDLGDRNLGDGRCDVSVNGGDQCTLRAAIEEINSAISNGPFRIDFDIPGVGPQVIAPAGPLDAITKPVIIDGTSQPAAYCATDNAWWLPNDLPANLQVVLDGRNLTSGNGLTLGPGSSGSEIRGLVIGGFPEQGVHIASDNNLVACSHIGIDAAGTAAFDNGLNGVRVSGDDNRIGGSSAGLRNIVSGNGMNGLLLVPGASGNTVQGNFVGTNAAGDAAVGNGEAGIRLITATDNRLGGVRDGAANIISGNGASGIHLQAGSDGNMIWGNFIGTDRVGETAVPNQTGLLVRNSHNNELGGSGPAKGNLIAGNTLNGMHLNEGASANLIQHNTIGLTEDGTPLGNGSDGIRLDTNVTATQIEDNVIAYSGAAGITLLPTAANNAIYQNSLFDNAALGIDLNGDGLTPHDGPGDPDSGANRLQNYPLLRSANPITGDISGTMEGAGLTEYRLDFYWNNGCDPSAYGEGQVHLGTGTVTTDAAGSQTFTVPVGGFALGDFITATATDPDGNTSEFSFCLTAGGSPPS